MIKEVFTHHLLVQNCKFCLTSPFFSDLFCNSRLAHHEAMLMRRTKIRGSDSSEDSDDYNNNNDEEESDDMEWGPATEL